MSLHPIRLLSPTSARLPRCSAPLSLSISRLPRHAPSQPSSLIRVRSLHQTPSTAWPRKGAEDKDTINRESMEYTRSGTDDRTAEQEEAAFDPNITHPQDEHKKAGEGLGVSHEQQQQRSQPKSRSEPNPMDVSPANPDVSEPKPDDDRGAEHAPGEKRVGSGGGSGMKSKK